MSRRAGGRTYVRTTPSAKKCCPLIILSSRQNAYHFSPTRLCTIFLSKQQPCPLGTWPAPWECACLWFTFLSFLFLSVLLCLSSHFSCFFGRTYVTRMDIFLVLFGCIAYGMVYHSSLAPFPCVPWWCCGACITLYSYIFFYLDFFLFGLSCGNGLDFKEMS